jgi:hypothetical protein
VCLASHSNGFMGQSLEGFLEQLVYNVQLQEVRVDQVDIAGIDLLLGATYTIPFLSPPNQKWPDYFGQIPGCNFDNLERTKNMDRVDFRTTSGDIVGESKDYGRQISLDTMRGILNRIPANARLQVIFTRKLQASYFNKPALSFEEDYAGNPRVTHAYFKIDAY